MKEEKWEKRIDELANSTASKIVIYMLEQKVEELDTVSGVETIRELQGRKNAITKLKQIINRLQPKSEKSILNEYN
jgi:hypothetical protein